jgi:hypothetical protein
MGSGYALKLCKYCGNETRNRTFCSKKCSGEDRVFNLVFSSIVTEELPHHPITAKIHLKMFYGDRCSICNLDKWLDKPLLLILDHIDGDASNWHITNLRLVCSNCDAQLPTYKFKNKGNGRFKRKERYDLGLSY